MNTRNIIVGLVASVCIAAPVAAGALSIDELQMQIKALLSRIASMQAQQAVAFPSQPEVISVTAVPRICMLDFAGSLRYGSRGEGVRGLQEFLKTEGALTAEATGYFGVQTQSAVQKWQASQGVVSSGTAYTTGWGVVGPATRARINARCGTAHLISVSPSSGPAPLNVQFSFAPPTDDSIQYYVEYGDGQGQVMDTRQIYCIRAPCISPKTATHTYTVSGDYTATVSRYFACLYSNPRCMMAQPAPIASINIHVEGSSSGNRPPTISSLSGPTTLSVNSTGTWTANASDPENGPLTYSIWWGDENVYAPSMSSAGASREFIQTSTFTHAYAYAGTYNVTITVRDSVGQEARTSSTVRVGNEQVACTMQYQPVCGRPSGCMNTCAPGMYCTMMCRMYEPQTYGNRCTLNAAGAEYLYDGECRAN